MNLTNHNIPNATYQALTAAGVHTLYGTWPNSSTCVEILLEGYSSAPAAWSAISQANSPTLAILQNQAWNQIGIAYSGPATGGQTYGNYWSIILSE